MIFFSCLKDLIQTYIFLSSLCFKNILPFHLILHTFYGILVLTAINDWCFHWKWLWKVSASAYRCPPFPPTFETRRMRKSKWQSCAHPPVNHRKTPPCYVRDVPSWLSGGPASQCSQRSSTPHLLIKIFPSCLTSLLHEHQQGWFCSCRFLFVVAHSHMHIFS